MGERGTCPKSLMEWVNGCRELGRCLVVCSGFDELIRFESLVVHCDEFRCPPNETLCFLFYRPRESRGYIRGKKGESEGEEIL